MEKKSNSLKANRILYLVVVGVLVIASLVIGLTAAFGRKDKTPEPNPNGGTGTEQRPTDENTTPEDQKPEGTVYRAPATGVVSKRHDMDAPVYSITMDDYRVHQGIDIAASVGDDVLATASGTVKLVWSDPLMGECVSVDHGNGVVSIYKNLAKEKASGIAKGASVAAGQKLGTVGETAMIECAESPHLHFEMEYEGVQVDPLSYISEESYRTSLSEDTAYES